MKLISLPNQACGEQGLKITLADDLFSGAIRPAVNEAPRQSDADVVDSDPSGSSPAPPNTSIRKVTALAALVAAGVLGYLIGRRRDNR